ncbi:MAG: hypothetical protein ACOC44_05880 [Promethearchaeia archaeon]
MKVRFRLVGVPPAEAEKEIEIDPEMTVAEVKQKVIKEFNLSSEIDINLINTGKQDNKKNK